MPIVVIDGKRLDTEKAKRRWKMTHFDGSNQHWGALYLSSKGTWYIHTPSQWANGSRWELADPAEVLETYAQYFDDETVAEILDLAGLDTE